MKHALTILSFLILTFFTAYSQLSISAETFLSGPTVGAPTIATTPIFFAVDKGNESAQFTIRVIESTTGTSHTPYEISPFCSGDVCSYIASFANLPAEQNMTVRIYRNGSLVKQSLNPFKIANNNNIQDFDFLVGSCAGLGAATDAKEDIFPQMASENAEFMLWLGDMVYLPSSNLDTFVAFDTYLRYTTLSPKRNQLYQSFFHFGMWDDHDYSSNNGTADYADKKYTTRLFKTWLPSPGYEHPGSTGGIQNTFKYRDIEFFNTDVRYYKTYNDHLGDEQLDWLKQKLLQSNAAFKFIQFGTPVLDTRTVKDTETSLWQTGERAELFDFIYTNNIEGVVFLSGDLHRSHFIKHNPGCNSTYPFYEFMSSPLSSGQSSGSVVYAGAFYEDNTRSYGKISITGPAGNRICQIENRDINGNVLASFSINENELKFSGQSDADPAAALHAHYLLANSTSDVSGNQYNGTISGTDVLYANDRYNNFEESAQINTGGSQFKTLNLPNPVLDQLLDFTISFWVKPTTTGVGLVSGSSATIGNEMLMYYHGVETFSINVKNNTLQSKDTYPPNEWYHVVATHRGGNGLSQIYVNGVFQGEEIHPTGPLSIVSLLCWNDQDGAGGGNLSPIQQLYGNFDDLRVYDEALCLYQIEEMYEEGIPQLSAVTSPIVCNPPTTATFQATGTTNGNYRWYNDRFSPNAIPGATNATLTQTLTESKTLWVSAFTPWKETERIPVSIEVAPQILTEATGYSFPEGLTASYPIIGNGNDETGNFGALSPSGPTLTTGMDGTANGAYTIGSYPNLLTIPHQTLDKAEHASVSFWVNTTDENGGILSAASPTTGNLILIYLQSSTSMSVWMNNGYRSYRSAGLTDGNWHHLAFTFDGKEALVHAYLDGVHMEITSWGNAYCAGTFDIPSGAFVFGNDNDTPGGGGFDPNQQFEGAIDELKFYRRLLSESEIEVLAARNDVVNQPFQIDASPNFLCENDTLRLRVFPYQENINYELLDFANAPLSSTVEIEGDSLVFYLPITQNESLTIVGNDPVTGCSNTISTANNVNLVGCLELEAWLEGAYDQTTGQMYDLLRQAGLVPTNYNNKMLNPDLLNVAGSRAIVDWVTIELRDESDPSMIVFSRAGLILVDGTIVGEGGGGLSIPSNFTGDYYVAVHHRNHLPVLTDAPISLPVSGAASYNFKTNLGYIVGLGSSQKLLMPGTYGLFMGNGESNDPNGYDINGVDLIIWKTENGTFNNYLDGDFDMDGDVNGQDKSKMLPNNGIFSTVPK